MRRTALVLSLCFSFALFGEDVTEKPSVKETIVVSATRSERDVSELPVSATVVSEEQLTSAPAVYVDDVLRTIPGVQLPLGNNPILATLGAKISMHGLGEISALVLVDGIPLHDPYDSTVQWGKVSLEDLRQIEVVRGASASLFGNHALGGVINMMTRPVEKNAIRADLSWGSYQTGRAVLEIDHRLNESTSFRVTHARNDSNGYWRVPNPGPVDIHTWNDSAVTSARVDWNPSDRTRSFLKANWSEVDTSQGSPLGYSLKDMFEVAGSITRLAGNSDVVTSTLFHQRSKEHLLFSFTDNARTVEFLSTDSIIPTEATSGSLEWSRQFFNIGVDVQKVNLTGEERDTFAPTGALVRHNTVHGEQLSGGVFAQSSWRPSARIEVLTSARLDYFRNSDGVDQVRGGALTHYPAKTTTRLDPRVSMRYALGDRTAIRGSVYRGFKAPTLRSLYRTAQIGPTTVLGNPNLEPQTLAGAEVGFDHSFGRARVDVTVYRNEMEKFQVRAHAPGQPANIETFLNLGKIRAQGVETMFTASLARGWTLDAGYTYADTIITGDPTPSLIGNHVPDVPLHYGTLGLRWLHNETTVQLRGRVVSSSYSDPRNIAAAQAHRVVDVFIGRPIASWADGYLRFENAFDERYYYLVNATSPRNAPPRIITGGVRLRFAARGRG